MSQSRTRLPATTARAIAFVGVLGTLALVVREPVAGLGVLSGALVAVGVLALGGSVRRQTVGGALLAVGVAGGLAVLGLAFTLDLQAVALTATVAVGGGAIVATFGGGVSGEEIQRASPVALYVAIAAGTVAAVVLVVANGPVSPGDWFVGTSVASLAGDVVVVGVAVIAGLMALPPAAFSTPRTRTARVETRTALVVATGVVAALAAGSLGLAAVLAAGVPWIESALSIVTGTVAVRLTLAGVGLAGLAVAAAGAFFRLAWQQRRLAGMGHVGALVGGSVGVGLAAALVFAIEEPTNRGVGLLGAIAAVCLVGSALAAWYPYRTPGEAPSSAATVVLALALLLGGVVVGSVDGSTSIAGGAIDGGLPVIDGGLPALVAIAAGLFAYQAGRHGRSMAREVGLEGVERRPQLVRLGWTGAVVGVGFLVAAGGHFLATAIAPTLSVPATAAVVAGIGAIGAGAWLLLR